MKKTVTKEVTVIVCDRCDGDNRYSPATCFVCLRDVCPGCRAPKFHAKADELLGAPMQVCHDCAKEVGCAALVQWILDGANDRMRKAVAEWKEKVRA